MYVGVGNALITAPNQRALLPHAMTRDRLPPTFTDMTTSQNLNMRLLQRRQCWYDNVVYSPPGSPDVVYIGGSYSLRTQYGLTTNGRAFLLSTDAGATFTDMTWDATTNPTPAAVLSAERDRAERDASGQHAIVAIPGTDSAIFGSDGGLVRSSGSFADISAQCDTRGLSAREPGAAASSCSRRCPTPAYDLNKGLSTLQFQSLSVAADNPKHLQGGTQDNGTFETTARPSSWPQIIYGDGGQSGFNADEQRAALQHVHRPGARRELPERRPDEVGHHRRADRVAARRARSSIRRSSPIRIRQWRARSSRARSSVWRTQDWGGNQAFLEANCPEFTTSSREPGLR